MIRIVIYGLREYADFEIIDDLIQVLSKDTIIIYGCRKGEDLLVKKISEERELKYITCPADWKRYGQSAGPLRNTQMLLLNPDMVIVFHDNIKSSCRKNLIKQAEKNKINLHIYNR
jgi:hypothetical protein